MTTQENSATEIADDFSRLIAAVEKYFSADKHITIPKPIKPEKPLVFTSEKELEDYRFNSKRYTALYEQYQKQEQIMHWAMIEAEDSIRALINRDETIKIIVTNGEAYAVWKRPREYDKDEVFIKEWEAYCAKYGMNPQTGQHYPEPEEEIESTEQSQPAKKYLSREVRKGLDALHNARAVFEEHYGKKPTPSQLIALAQVIAIQELDSTTAHLIPA